MPSTKNKSSPSKKLRPLTLKQKKFVAEYVKNGGNVTKAALSAYPNQNYNSAHVQGHENLQKPTVQKALQQACAQAGLSINRIGYHLNRWAESNVHDASLRAISLWGDFSGAKVHKIEGNITHQHEHSIVKDMQTLGGHIDTISV